MIVKTAGGYLRDLQVASQAFVVEKEAVGTIGTYRISRLMHKLPSNLHWKEDELSTGVLSLDQHQRFVIKEIETWLFTKEPQAYAGTTLRLLIGERSDFFAPVLGTHQNPGYHRRYELSRVSWEDNAHLVVEPNQRFLVELTQLPAAGATIQISFHGHVFNPVA